MKMTQEDYDKLKSEIEKIMPLVKREQCKSDMSYRWTLYHAVNVIDGEHFKFGHLYDYLNDDNIDTALKMITKDL